MWPLQCIGVDVAIVAIVGVGVAVCDKAGVVSSRQLEAAMGSPSKSNNTVTDAKFFIVPSLHNLAFSLCQPDGLLARLTRK